MANEVRIEQDDGAFQVFMPYDEDAKEALKEKFHAWWDASDKCWVIDDDFATEKEIEAELKLHFPRAFR